jgi:hypothetical protein
MVSPNEANLDLRERFPLSRNILHTCEVTAYGSTGQRTSQKSVHATTDYQDWLFQSTNLKVSTGHLNYPVDVRDTAKSGMGRLGNRHLSYLVEFISVNVGGSYSDAKASSLPMPDRSVGGVIVLRGRESRPQGEGRQGINIFLLESSNESDEFRACRKVTL